MSLDLTDLFQVGVDILRTTVSAATKRILCQTGNITASGGVSDRDGVEWWQHYGFASRPPKPEAGKKACQAIVVRQGGTDFAIASQDARGLELYGQLADGETCIFASGETGTAQARILLKKDGSINLFTKKGNDTGGAGMGAFINPDGSISIAGSEGNAVLLGSDGSIKAFNASGGIQVLADGTIKLGSGAKVVISGASITMGGPSALPIAIGPNVVTCINTLQQEITTLANALVQVGAAAALAPGAAGASAPGPVALSQITALATAVSAAAAIVPSQRVSSD